MASVLHLNIWCLMFDLWDAFLSTLTPAWCCPLPHSSPAATKENWAQSFDKQDWLIFKWFTGLLQHHHITAIYTTNSSGWIFNLRSSVPHLPQLPQSVEAALVEFQDFVWNWFHFNLQPSCSCITAHRGLMFRWEVNCNIFRSLLKSSGFDFSLTLRGQCEFATK